MVKAGKPRPGLANGFGSVKICFTGLCEYEAEGLCRSVGIEILWVRTSRDCQPEEVRKPCKEAERRSKN